MDTTTTRRLLIVGGAAGLALAVFKLRGLGFLRAEAQDLQAGTASQTGAAAAVPEAFAVTHTDEEWRKILSPKAYSVLRKEGTELPFTSPLLDEHRAGVFSCAGCELQLYSSNTKYESGTGWPSFWQPLDKAVNSRQDFSAGMVRDEVHCTRCGGHLGHVFDDGPQPTGLRYCMNGVAMNFQPAAA